MAGIGSRRSMTQYAAVARMRMQMLVHSVRTGRGRFNLVAQFSSYLSYLLLGSFFAAAFGAGAYHMLSQNRFHYLSLVIWGALLMWQLTPIMAISFREEYDLSDLARYPLGFGAFYILFLFFGLFDLSTIFGISSVVGFAIGIGMARADLLPVALAGLAIFAAFNIFVNRAIFAWLSRWLAQRRSREIVGIFFFVIVVGAELMNPAMHQFHLHASINLIESLKILEPFNALLPPGLICAGMQSLSSGHLLDAAISLIGMAAWPVIPAAILGLRLRAQYKGENLSEAPAQKTRAAKPRTRSLRFDVSGPVAAVMVKEARFLMRSYQLLYGLAAPLVLMVLFSGTSHHPTEGQFVTPDRFLFPVGVFYAFLGLTRLLYNSLGGEGTGLQFYFVSPVPFWKVMLGKNLFHSTLLGIEIAVLWAIALFRGGVPTLEVLILTLCAMTFIVPANFAAANLMAVQMPYRLNFARLGRAPGATASNLLSLVVQLTIGGVCAIAYFVTSALGGAWLTGIVFLAMGLAASTAYWIVLKGLGRRAQGRMDVLLGDLARVTG